MMLQLLPLEFLPAIFKIYDGLSAKSSKGRGKGCVAGWGFVLVLLFKKQNKTSQSEFVLTHIWLGYRYVVMAVLYDSLSLARLFQQSKKHMLSGRHKLVSYPIFQTKEKSRSLSNSPIPIFH